MSEDPTHLCRQPHRIALGHRFAGRPNLRRRSTLARLMTWLSPALSGRRLQLLARARMGGRGGPVRDACRAGGLDRGPADPRRRTQRCRSSWPRPGVPLPEAMGQLLTEVIELAAAFAPSAERRLETLAQGSRLPHRDAGGVAASRSWSRSASRAREVAYPVAVGACAAAHGLPLAPDGAGVRAGLCRQHRLGRRAADPARADATGCACWRAWSR